MPSYLGQNFLTDQGAKDTIIQTLTQMHSEYSLDKVIEIGPGQGALTSGLMSLFERLTLIEMDTKMKPYLETLLHQHSKQSTDNSLQIIRGDILQQGAILAYWSDKSHTLIYGSLPYYITSPILRLVMIESGHHHGLFIIQKEVGDKISTTARKKSYLWRLLNNEFEVTLTQIIPPHSFTPPPKVHSCVVKLTRLSEPKLSSHEYESMLILLNQINGFKRKTLGKIYKMIGRDDIPKQLASKRLEELEWEEMKLLIG